MTLSWDTETVDAIPTCCDYIHQPVVPRNNSYKHARHLISHFWFRVTIVIIEQSKKKWWRISVWSGNEAKPESLDWFIRTSISNRNKTIIYPKIDNYHALLELIPFCVVRRYDYSFQRKIALTGHNRRRREKKEKKEKIPSRKRSCFNRLRTDRARPTH